MIKGRADFYRIGVALVLLAASVLVLRAYLPRWVFGDPQLLTWQWPLTVFLAYVLQGLIVLACMRLSDFVADRRGVVSMWKRMLIGSALIMKCTGLATYLLIQPLSHLLIRGDLALLLLWMMSGALGSAAYACLLLYRASHQQRDGAARLQSEADQLAMELASAELAALEAQIEPHFLFNTLAHVKRHYRTDAVAADRMLASLIDYLERALPALRRTDWTIADELGLVRVYLDILAQRFGARLQYSIAVDERDRPLRVPALTVATLVENAVRHGLAPKTEGGTIHIQVERAGESVQIDVCDNGVGFRQTSGTGPGLATVRARLRSAFGELAMLLVEPRQPEGVRAAIRIPLRA